MDGRFPQGLQLGKSLLAEVPGIAPAVGKLVQRAGKGLPLVGLGACLIALGPGFHLLDQRQALRLVRSGLRLQLVQPGLHHLVGFIAGFVEALPQGMVGRATLVHGLPLFTQVTQGFLHLASAHRRRRRIPLGGRLHRCVSWPGRRRGFGRCGFGGRQRRIRGQRLRACDFDGLAFGHRGFGRRRLGWNGLGSWRLRRAHRLHRDLGPALQQRLGLGHEFFAQLVGAPALPAFEFPSRAQCRMHPRFQGGVQMPTMFLECIAQRGSGPRTGLAMTFADFLLDLLQHRRHGGRGFLPLLLPDGGVHFGLGRLRCRVGRQPAGGPQLLGPHGHRRQRRGSVGFGRDGQCQGGAEGVPHHQQLRARRIDHWRVFVVHARPVRIALQGNGLRLPVRNISLQGIGHRLGLFPGFGGQQFNALRQQHRGLALHHGLVLQILHHLDPFGQCRLQRGQRLARQRCTRLSGIALPGHGVGDVESRRVQQDLATRGPFGGQCVLGLGPAQFVELFAQGLGCALVLDAEFLEHLLHQLLGGRRGQPFAHPRRAVARGGGREGAARQGIQLLKVMGFGVGVGHGALGRVASESRIREAGTPRASRGVGYFRRFSTPSAPRDRAVGRAGPPVR